jgi:thymidine kinase
MAKLYFCYAAMNAGKSALLLQASWNYQERGMRTLLFTSSLYRDDTAARISSRIGIDAEARPYGEDDNLYEQVRKTHRTAPVSCVFVDEAQFLSPEQVWQLARVTDRLDVPVMCFGLRTDFRGRLFPGSAELLAIADNLREIRTICHCGRKATMVARMTPGGKAIIAGDQIGIDKDIYVSLCRTHWSEVTGKASPPRPKKPAVAAKAVKKPAKRAAEKARPARKSPPATPSPRAPSSRRRASP